jgi:DNA ligase-1
MLDLGSKINDLSREQGGLFGEEEVKPQFWVRSFTRNLDESSEQFPELGQVGEQILADEVILDSEAVGYDPKTGANVPFQLTITRKRKHGVVEAQKDVPLRFNVFDIMYLNGQSLIHLPLKERRAILEKTIKPGVVLAVDPYLETEDPGELREYHREQLKAGYGALVKQVNGTYMPGRTGFNWVKFKEAEDSRAKLSDTIDVVIMGYYLGKGKRSEFTLGAFLVGILDSRREERGESRIVTVAKVGTGITDLVFGELGERLEKVKILNPKFQILDKSKILNYNDQTMVVPETLTPDVWVEPKVVVEVAADEITVSPTHTAGYALRFPRLVKFRDDKNVENITTLDEIVAMGSI